MNRDQFTRINGLGQIQRMISYQLSVTSYWRGSTVYCPLFTYHLALRHSADRTRDTALASAPRLASQGVNNI
jgi:hypothetical protein